MCYDKIGIIFFVGKESGMTIESRRLLIVEDDSVLRERLNAKIEMLRKNRIEAAKKNDKKQRENRQKRVAEGEKAASKEKRVKEMPKEEDVPASAPSVTDVISK